jgi:alanine-synthesizing transaminase
VFSSRVPANLAPNRVTEALRARRENDDPLIDLTESNPTRAGFEYPPDLLEPLGRARGLDYRPAPLGSMEARRAVAADYARQGVRVTPDRIVLTASTSDGYSLLFKLLADAGDDVLVPRPGYPLFDYLTRLDLVATRYYDLELDGSWSIDFGSLEGALTPRTRAVLVVSPNNPTGSFVSRDELDRLAAICGPRGIAIVADEVFADYELEAGAAARAGRVAERDDVLSFALGGLSKSVGLPQVKLGWMAVGGSDRLVADALERLELVCDTYLAVSTRRGRTAGGRRGRPETDRVSDRREQPCAGGRCRRRALLPFASRRGRLVQGLARAVARARRGSRGAPAERGRSDTPWLLL